jgi:hypothetical protein
MEDREVTEGATAKKKESIKEGKNEQVKMFQFSVPATNFFFSNPSNLQ